MEFIFNGKPVLPTKQVLDELSQINSDLYEVMNILEYGFPIRKRKKNIIERGLIQGNKVINVVVVDMGNYYKLIHAGKFSLAKKFKRMNKQNNEL